MRLYITTARWLARTKRSVRPQGVIPDILVEPQQTESCEPTSLDNDSQLQSAVEVVKTRPPTIADVARLLLERNAVVQAPARGQTKWSIKEGAETFPMPGGESPVVVVRLPQYAPGSTTTISSLKAKNRGQIFVPSGVYLDEQLNWLREEQRLLARGTGLQFQVPEYLRKARYFVMYTRADLVGKAVGGYGVGVAGLERSPTGEFEVNTSPDSQRK